MENNKIFEIEKEKYEIKVGFYEDTKCLKVSLENIETKEIEELTLKGIELMIPAPPTPDCVMIDIKYEKIIKKLIDIKVLDYCHSIFAKFNMEELYKYDKKGTMSFLELHTIKIEFVNDKGNSLEEVKKELKKEVQSLLIKNETKRFLLEKAGTTKFNFRYALINYNVPKASFVVIEDLRNNTICFVNPYIDNLENKFNFISNEMFSFEEGLMYYLEKDYEILGINKHLHNKIWNEIEEKYPDFEYVSGTNKYLKYCKDKGINKKTLRRNFLNVRNISKLYEQIEKNEGKSNGIISMSNK